MDTEKRIEVVYMKASDIKKGFGNPRKIGKRKKDELKRSLHEHGDFGCYIIDENDNIIAGNQRLDCVLDDNPETELLCKRLIGYSDAEKKAINIKDNTHAGDWDLDLLAAWTADLNLELGLDVPATDPAERKISDMELIRYEKYDYVMIVCRNEIDYLNLTRMLGIDDKKVVVHKQRKIKARAIWFDDIKAQIVPKEGEWQ